MFDTVIEAADILRFITLALLIISLFACLAVNRLYYKAMRQATKREGLAPIHVFLVTLGVILMQTMLAWALMSGSKPTEPAQFVRFIGYAMASAIIIAALYIVGNLQKRRVEFTRETTRTLTVTDTNGTHISDPEQD